MMRLSSRRKFSRARVDPGQLLTVPDDCCSCCVCDRPQLLHALRRILRWLHDPGAEGLSDYMLASEARVLMEELAPELRFAGLPAYDSHACGAEYWPQVVDRVRAAVSAIIGPSSS